MQPQVTLLKLTLCGPSDVKKEFTIAREVIDEWNIRNGEVKGFWIKYQHWSTDAYPDLNDRPQGVINRQLIDGSDLLLAIFWSRFGTPTGAANSGTEEEIRRGIQNGKKVMVYFSNLEPLPPEADAGQIHRLCQFRQELFRQGLCWTFNSRTQFRNEFTNHLAQVLNGFTATPKKTARRSAPSVKQTAKGKNIVQAGGDIENVTINQHPPTVKNVMERRPGSISSEEALHVREWIAALAEGETRMTREAAFSMWWKRLYSRFKVEKYEALLSMKMDDVKSWYHQQVAIQKRGLKSKAPELWRCERIRAIKAAMTQMDVVKEAYYAELERRLKIKPFDSLKDLTDRNLERVYRMALRDKQGS